MIYPDRAARDAALGRDAASEGAAQPQHLQPVVTADGREVVVRVECTHPVVDTRTIAWGIVRGWLYIVVILLVLGVLLAALGVSLDVP